MGTTEDSKALMWRITDEIWIAAGELIDELIAQDLVDHVELAGLEATGLSSRFSVAGARSP